MRICEIFSSVQGESCGSNYGTGFYTIFVRFTGCSIGCLYCDTKYANSESPIEMDVLAVVNKIEEIREKRPKRVCITGGDPDAVPVTEMRALIAVLKDKHYYVTVEASGHKNPLERYSAADSIVMDIKGPSAGEHAMAKTQNSMIYATWLRSEDQIKFLVADRTDFDFMIKSLEMMYNTGEGVHLTLPKILASPVFSADGNHNAAQVVQWIINANLEYDIILNLQIHKLIWNPNERGR